ncbi:sensor histidine kinase [Streptomyces sp. M41]|uniref:sensor histidine kinase n=1 Tax=Streptomyces sp. M41 TaxID=3059412 RepID=UPI00374C9275
MGDNGDWRTSGLMAALVVACAAVIALMLALLRTRRRWQHTVGERGWLLERERESAARAAVAAERDRIARELHDIVSHNVSLMVVQAGAAREVLTTMPNEAVAALRAVEDAGRGAMTDLRHLLGLLAPSPSGEDNEAGEAAQAREVPVGAWDRDAGSQGPSATKPGGEGAGAGREGDERLRGEWPGTGRPDLYAGTAAELAPQPGLDRLGRLVDRVSFAGLPVEVRISGEPCPLPQGIDVTAYRIVQEALTNALKHGDGGKAEVTVRYADHALRVEVLSTGPSVLTGGTAPSPRPTPRHSEGTGRGLLGLRERVAVYGGDLDARRRLGGGYRVRARIPLDRP